MRRGAQGWGLARVLMVAPWLEGALPGPACRSEQFSGRRLKTQWSPKTLSRMRRLTKHPRSGC